MNIDKFLDDNARKDLLRFITCGAVDDGKSTLIGRLLYDSKLIFEDQLHSLKQDSSRIGTTKETGEIDYALLLDGLKAEREQGITIDVAYRYFSTPKRKFIIADTPGHEEYTRNMATGASTADLAVILVDARAGVITQTKRHAFITALLGIKHIVVAVNKMDLVDYSKDVFDDIKDNFAEFTAELELPEISYIPLSALKGDNVVDKSARMTWYRGKPLLQTLEDVDIVQDRNLTDFRFPVQYVIRPHLDFRGFAGTVVSGLVAVGDAVKVLPSGKDSVIKAIVTADGMLKRAFAPQAVTLQLEDEIDISSGDMLVHSDNQPKVSKYLEAVVIWMNEQPLNRETEYIIRHNGRNVKGYLRKLLYKIDVNTLKKESDSSLRLNEIGRIVITTNQPLYYDAYAQNRETGSLIVIDPISNVTLGAAMIAPSHSFSYAGNADETLNKQTLQEHIKQREFAWDTGLVSKHDRTVRNRHRGKTLMITGRYDNTVRELGKQLELRLFKLNMNSYYLGIDNLLSGLDADINDDFWERDEHIRRIGELARIMTDAGLIFIVALTKADDYDAHKLKLLNYPNELLIVNLGNLRLHDVKSDLMLPENSDIDDALEETLLLLSLQNVIPDYCI